MCATFASSHTFWLLVLSYFPLRVMLFEFWQEAGIIAT
uniref:Uncharacterized protein n=1 Tax=Klebsiella pneumoniae TaxID=573 RepID=A0A6G9I024_KLEPN|nr:hypothetical protein [Klebsiella pneumoniae]QIQ16098.1 hypothetical protein [Klebsiella pneumoniae]